MTQLRRLARLAIWCTLAFSAVGGLVHGATLKPVLVDPVVTKLAPPESTSRSWLLALDADGVPANTTQPRWLTVVLGGQDGTLPYTLTNTALAAFSWTVRGLPSLAIRPGDPIPVSISVTSVPATAVKVLQTGLIEKESMQLISRTGLTLCESATSPCTSGTVNIPPNTAAQLWLWGTDRPGKFEGSVVIASAEKPAGESISMTIYSTSLCYQIVGVFVILFGVVLAWFCTVFIRNRLNRDQLLLPAATVRTALAKLQAALDKMPGDLAAPKTTEKIASLLSRLADTELESNGLPPAFAVPWGTATNPATLETYRKYVQTLASAQSALNVIVHVGLEQVALRRQGATTQDTIAAVIAAFSEIDRLAAVDPPLTEEQLVVVIRQKIAALDARPVTEEGRSSAAPTTPVGRTREDILVEIAKLSSAAWLFMLLATTGAGAYILIFSNAGAGFGTARDFLVCLLWGAGLPTGAQLMQATTGTIATTFGVTK